MERPFEDSVISQLGGSAVKYCNKVLPEGCICRVSISYMVLIQGPRNQGVETGEAPFILTHHEQLANVLLPIPETLFSTGLEVLVPEEGMLPPGDTTVILLNWKLRMPPGNFGFLLPLNQLARKGATVMAGMIDPDYH